MTRKLTRTYKAIIFALIFSSLILYQQEFILSKYDFGNVLSESFPTISNKASVQSYGFFDDISNTNWETYRKRYQTQHRHIDNDVRNQRNHIDDHGHDENENEKKENNAHLFYRDNYDAEFTCMNEVQMGVAHDHKPHLNLQTPKWLCDPHRILLSSRERARSGGNGCLIYAFNEGKGNPIRFLKDMREQLGDECEIHVFAPHFGEGRTKHLEAIPNLYLHSWGLEGKSDVHLGRNSHLTLHETMIETGHAGHTIDVLSMDCDGCEWSTYKDILDSESSITQILVELHGAPYQINDFFLEMNRNGYASFHKESNTIEKGGGQNHAYSFIRLAPAFFELEPTSSRNEEGKDLDAQPLLLGIQEKSAYQRRQMH